MLASALPRLRHAARYSSLAARKHDGHRSTDGVVAWPTSGMPPSRHSINKIRGRRASWAGLELVGSRRPASLDPDRSATKSRQSASVGSAWRRASRNLASALNSASWRLIVVFDLPADFNARITRAEASGIAAASIGTGLSDRGEQTGDSPPAPPTRQRPSPIPGLCGRNRHARQPRQRKHPGRPHNPAVHIMPLMGNST